MGRRITKAKRATGASIARASAAILAFPAGRSSAASGNPTIKGVVKDIKVPHHVSAAEVNSILAQRARQISATIHKEEQIIAKILEDTAKQIAKVHGNSRK
jgi:hypothetical protein